MQTTVSGEETGCWATCGHSEVCKGEGSKAFRVEDKRSKQLKGGGWLPVKVLVMGHDGRLSPVDRSVIFYVTRR